MKYFLSTVSFLILFTGTVYADSTSLFSFVTDPQSVALGELSGPMTIQSQSASGVPIPVTETYDLVFVSSSVSGQFLNSSGNSVTTYMSKNTSNRTFYYRDSSSGDFIITVSATGRDSKLNFTTNQHIFVGLSSQPNNSQNNSTTTTNQSSESDTTSKSSSSENLSSHSSPSSLSTISPKIESEVSAGRDRLALVGSRVLFKALPTKLSGVPSESVSYKWSFGDGAVDNGESVYHIYKFAGDYSVVVNSSVSDKQAVDRINVKVISPKILFSRVDGGFEVTNLSGYEINLQDWILESPRKLFIFPQDTIIMPNKKVVFADEVTGVMDTVADLKNPGWKIFASVKSSISESSFDNSQKVTGLAETYSTSGVNTASTTNNFPISLGEVKKISLQKPETKKTSTQSGLLAKSSATSSQVATVFVATENNSFIKNILSFPMFSLSIIKNLFSKK